MIDYAALLGATAGIHVAKADYDFTRDASNVGQLPIQSEIVPEGSIILGWTMRTTTAFTFGGAGSFYFVCGRKTLGTPSVDLDKSVTNWPSAAAAIVTDANSPITALIEDEEVTAGAATVWVFYLPT